jgi:hypothetical protein
MSRRLDKSWTIFKSIENPEHDRCVDFFVRPGGTYGFEEFRRDVEDQGAWTPVSFFSGGSYSSEAEARREARNQIPWFDIVAAASE